MPYVVQISPFSSSGFLIGTQGIDDDALRCRPFLLIHVDTDNELLKKKLIVSAGDLKLEASKQETYLNAQDSYKTVTLGDFGTKKGVPMKANPLK